MVAYLVILVSQNRLQVRVGVELGRPEIPIPNDGASRTCCQFVTLLVFPQRFSAGLSNKGSHKDLAGEPKSWYEIFRPWASRSRGGKCKRPCGTVDVDGYIQNDIRQCLAGLP